MVEDFRNAAISQLNHAISTLTAAVDTATVRHHLDYVKTRLSQYIQKAEAMLEIKDLQLVAKQNEIKTMEKIIQDLEEQNRSLREKHNLLPPPAHAQNWQTPDDKENDSQEDEKKTIEELQEENKQLRFNRVCMEDLISQCEPSVRNYLRGRNWRAPEDGENDCEDVAKTIEQLREENQQLRLNRRSLENRISGCDPSVRNYLFG